MYLVSRVAIVWDKSLFRCRCLVPARYSPDNQLEANAPSIMHSPPFRESHTSVSVM